MSKKGSDGPPNNSQDANESNNMDKRRRLDEIQLMHKTNRYSAQSEAPFIVHMMDSRENEYLGNIHPMLLGRTFRLGNIFLVSIGVASSEQVVLNFHSFQDIC